MEIKLNLGCGGKPILRDEWINYDINPIVKEAKKLDIENDTFPHESDTVNVIYMIDVIEHIGDKLNHCLNECHRVLKKEGRLYIETPHFPHQDSIKDPTHKRYFVPETFSYFGQYREASKIYGFKPWNIADIYHNERRIKVTLIPDKNA